MLLVPGEFEEAQRDYPLLFRRNDDGSFHAVALLGLDRGENLFLGDDRWSARYIPAMVRREPFLLGEKGDEFGDELSLFIDLDDPRVSELEGEPLFLPCGGNARRLQEAASALRIIHDGRAQAAALFALLAELKLIQPIEVQVQLDDGLEYRIPDVFSISADELAALAGERLDRLHRSGFLTHAIFARSSLGNFNRLVELKTAKLLRTADA